MASARAQAIEPTSAAKDPSAVTIMLSIDDELGDIPEEQRLAIANEISSFRERSVRRDIDRARRYEEIESQRLEIERAARQKTKTFNVASEGDLGEITMIRRSKRTQATPEDDHLSDADLLKRKQDQVQQSLDLKYRDEERRWQNRESTHLAAVQRGIDRQNSDKDRVESLRNSLAAKLATWDDEAEAARGHDLYYTDHSAWSRARQAFRAKEKEADRLDELDEESERRPVVVPELVNSSESEDEADTEALVTSSAAPRRLALNLRTTEVIKVPAVSDAVLIDDEEKSSKRSLQTVQYEETNGQAEHLSREARIQAVVKTIPIEKDDLWSADVKWANLNQDLLLQFRKFVAKKLVEAIGMEEEDLIAYIMRKVEAHGTPAEIEGELSMAIGDAHEAELLTVKCWRFLLILLETYGM